MPQANQTHAPTASICFAAQSQPSICFAKVPKPAQRPSIPLVLEDLSQRLV